MRYEETLPNDILPAMLQPLLHLIAHYELGNFQLMEYLIKSVYRFMAKMENLGVVEEEMFAFLRRSFHLSAANIKPELEKLLHKLKQHENNRLENRAFMYLDVALPVGVSTNRNDCRQMSL